MGGLSGPGLGSGGGGLSGPGSVDIVEAYRPVSVPERPCIPHLYLSMVRAAAWLDQIAPELRPRSRGSGQLLRQLDGVLDPGLTVRR
jgi:hypothetical protein